MSCFWPWCLKFPDLITMKHFRLIFKALFSRILLWLVFISCASHQWWFFCCPWYIYYLLFNSKTCFSWWPPRTFKFNNRPLASSLACYLTTPSIASIMMILRRWNKNQSVRSVDGMVLTGENLGFPGKTWPRGQSVRHISHIEWSGIELTSPRGLDGDYTPETWAISRPS
jgi:hypothetical protein